MYNSTVNSHIQNRSPKFLSQSGDVVVSHSHQADVHLSNPATSISRSLSPVPPRRSRSSNNSPLSLSEAGHMPHSLSTSAFSVTQPYYSSGDDPTSPVGGNSATGRGHRSRPTLRAHHSVEGVSPQERGFMPIREGRDRSLDRQQHHHRHSSRSRDRSLDRLTAANQRERDEMYAMDRVDDELYPNPEMKHGITRDKFVLELQSQINDVQNKYMTLKKDLDLTSQKLCSSMHSIKTFWSPELKKERALRKEEAAKYALMNDQLKLLNGENQKQSKLIEQLEEELRMSQMRNPSGEMQHQFDAMYMDREHQSKENYLLRETIKELELRVETQKQTLNARDESIKKLLEMLQSKGGSGGKMVEEERLEYERMKTRLIEMEARARHLEGLLDLKDKDLGKLKEVEDMKIELAKRDQEIMAMGAKMKTLEEQHTDYQRHISVLKESLCAKEEHYNMLQADVEELRQRLEEKNKLIEKKTHQTVQATQDRNRLNSELNELKDHMDIKDRKINVLQRKADIQNLTERVKNSGKGNNDQELNEIANAKKELMERHKSLEETEKKLKKRKEKLDQMEAKAQKADMAQNEALAKEIAELTKKCQLLQKENQEKEKLFEQSKQGGSQVQAELDRLLQILTKMEEEKFNLNKQVKELQDALESSARAGPNERRRNPSGQDDGRRREHEQQKPKPPLENEVLAASLKEIEEYKAKINEMQVAIIEGNSVIEDLRQTNKSKESLLKKANEDIKALNVKCNENEMEDLKNKINELKYDLAESHKKDERIHELEKQLEDKFKADDDDEDLLVYLKRIEELEEALKMCEEQLDSAKCDVGDQGIHERVEELEEALRESVRITADRELMISHYESTIKAAEATVGKQQAELRSLQNVQNARCTTCPSLKVRLQSVETKLNQLLGERQSHLQEMFDAKHEALSAAMSEKDTRIALLEMSGIKDMKTSDEVDRLREEKRKLINTIKVENEQRVKFMAEYELVTPTDVSEDTGQL